MTNFVNVRNLATPFLSSSNLHKGFLSECFPKIPYHLLRRMLPLQGNVEPSNKLYKHVTIFSNNPGLD